MKLMAMAICLACLPAFGQDAPLGRMGPPGVMLRRAETLSQISKAIDQHRSFRLPDNSFGSDVTAIAIFEKTTICDSMGTFNALSTDRKYP